MVAVGGGAEETQKTYLLFDCATACDVVYVPIYNIVQTLFKKLLFSFNLPISQNGGVH